MCGCCGLQLKALQEERAVSREGKTPDAQPATTIPRPAATKSKRGRESKLPPTDATNPLADLVFDPVNVEQYVLQKTFRGHLNAVAGVVFHPRKPVFATVSDDETWKLWSAPNCDLIMSGEGHTDWLAGKECLVFGISLLSLS